MAAFRSRMFVSSASAAWAASWPRSLASAGLKVVGFERGPAPKREDYAPRDSIRFLIRPEQLEWVRHEPTTTRKQGRRENQLAVSHQSLERVGRRAAALDRTVVALHARRFQDFTATRSKAATPSAPRRISPATISSTGRSATTISNRITKTSNGSSASRDRPGSTPSPGRASAVSRCRRCAIARKMKLFAEACTKLGYHPYDTAAGIASQPYNPAAPFDTRIDERPACVYCGHCNFYGCHVHAKSASLYITIPVAVETGNFDLQDPFQSLSHQQRRRRPSHRSKLLRCRWPRARTARAGGDLERVCLRACALAVAVEDRFGEIRQRPG